MLKTGLLKPSCFCRCLKAFNSSKCQEADRVIYSGIQPTGLPHIGNYLGAIKNWTQLQDEPGKHIYCIVDLHSLTIPKDREVMQSSMNKMMACLLACGLDPQKSIIYRQSDVYQHTQLAWIFSSLVSTTRLDRFPQWKEKSKSLGDTHGLYSYPVLQAADILLYNTTHVPVGADQAVHVHLTNEISEKFNKTYGEIFPKVEIYSADAPCSRVLNLRDPTSKMSKSAPSQMARVDMTDSDDDIWLKIRRAVTDCQSQVTYEPESRPGVSNLIRIHSGFSGLSHEEICRKAEDLNTGQYKMAVAESVIDALRPIRSKYEELIEDEDYLNQVLRDGGEQASEIAQVTWEKVREVTGISRLKSPSGKKIGKV